jgi:hypothetical protein
MGDKLIIDQVNGQKKVDKTPSQINLDEHQHQHLRTALKDKLSAPIDEYREGGEGSKASGVSSGFVGRTTENSNYMLKPGELGRVTNPARNNGSPYTDKRDAMQEYIAAGIYKRILYDRTPTIGLADVSNSSNIDDKGKLFIKSKFFEGFQSLNMVRDNPSKDLEGFEKVIAACLFAGEVDYHGENLGVVNNKVVKIDHGRSGMRLYSKESRLKLDLRNNLLVFGYGKIPLNSRLLKESISEISQISEDEIEKIVASRIDSLKKSGFILEKEVQFFTDAGLVTKKIDNYNDLENIYVYGYTQQQKILKAFEATLDIISKIEYSTDPAKQKDWQNGDWLRDIGEKDPLEWAVRRDKRIAGLDPVIWAIQNNKKIENKDALEWAVNNGKNIESQDPVSWAVKNNKKIQDQDPIEWTKSNNYKIEGKDHIAYAVANYNMIEDQNPIVWAVLNNCKIEGQDPVVWAIDNQERINHQDPLLWAARGNRKIEGKSPVVWAMENNKKIQSEDPLLWAVNNKEKIEGQDPIVWAVDNSKEIESQNPLDWAIKNNQQIGYLTSLAWAVENNRKIEDQGPLSWALEYGNIGDPVVWAMSHRISIEGKNPVVWAIDNGKKVEDQDPVAWAAKNNRRILGMDPIVWAAHNNRKIDDQNPIVWAAKNNINIDSQNPVSRAVYHKNKIEGQDPILWAVENKMEINYQEPIEWAVLRKIKIDDRDPIVLAIEHNKIIQGYEPIIWAQENDRKIEDQDPVIWAIEHNKLLDGVDPILSAVQYNEEIEGQKAIIWVIKNNKKIDGKNPADYLKEVEKDNPELFEELNEELRKHKVTLGAETKRVINLEDANKKSELVQAQSGKMAKEVASPRAVGELRSHEDNQGRS